MSHKIIAALFLTMVSISNVSAEGSSPVAYMSNQDSGRIELYLNKAPVEAIEYSSQCQNALIAKTWGVNTEDSYGCWKAQDDVISIFWVTDGGISRTYYSKNFTITKYGNKVMGEKIK